VEKVKHLGEDVSEILEYVPASLKVISTFVPSCLRVLRSHRAAEAPSDRSSEALWSGASGARAGIEIL